MLRYVYDVFFVVDISVENKTMFVIALHRLTDRYVASRE